MKVAVLGLGRFGRVLARALARAGVEVLAADKDPQLVERVKDQVALAVRMDTSDERSLREHGLAKMDAVVVAIGEHFEANVLTTATLKQIGARRIITRHVEEVQGRILSLVGADEVIAPEDDAALRLAQRLVTPNVIEWVDFGEGFAAMQVETPSHFVGRDLKDLDLRNKYQVNVVAIRKGKDGKARVPLPDTVIEAGDVIIVVGTEEALEELMRR
ncbi:MAG: TrkA family potassium uptake protein [Planctomycetes bacterium]|nr:TrkA family potassium uptake protein [Planctomycetota bacterium]